MGEKHWSYRDYDLIARYGNGDGSFKKPKLIQRYKGKPTGLH